MKRFALFLGLALLGGGCNGTQPATGTPTPTVETRTEINSASLPETLDNKITRPRCDAISSISNSKRVGTWTSNNDRGLSKIFPPLPNDTVLCGHFRTTKILIYATGLSPNEIMNYYEQELSTLGFTTERKQQLFKGVGILGFTKEGIASGSISADGNKGFISITYIQATQQ